MIHIVRYDVKSDGLGAFMLEARDGGYAAYDDMVKAMQPLLDVYSAVVKLTAPQDLEATDVDERINFKINEAKLTDALKAILESEEEQTSGGNGFDYFDLKND